MFVFEDNGANYINPKNGKYRDYGKICDDLNRWRDKGDTESSKKAKMLMRKLCKEDLFFLLYFILDVKPVNEKWVVDRIHEVEEQNDQTLDIWAREHFKSTVITYGCDIQSILNNKEERVGILSGTRQIAKAFLRRIKITFESNELLKAIFDDVLYQNPEKQSPKWSEDEGLIVKRKGVYNEATVEAWGMDNLPTGKHFTILNYDDLVDETTVNTPDQMKKLKKLFQLSDSLGVDIPGQTCKRRVIGTIYHYMDLNQELSESGDYFVRKYPAEVDGEPVLMSKETLMRKRKTQGSYVYSCQMMLDPVAKDEQKFRPEWLTGTYYGNAPANVNKVIIVDPANEKKPQSSYTVMVCLGIDPLRDYFLLDMVRDKLKLNERWDVLKEFAQRNGCRKVYYEKNGMGAIDIQYHREKMQDEGIFFNIEPISNARETKESRIEKLQPLFEFGRFHLPHVLMYQDIEDKPRNLIHELINDEYVRFPFCVHYDMLDCIASMKNEKVEFHPPRMIKEKQAKPWNPLESEPETNNLTFMSV